MKILVTGGQGKVGRFVVQELVNSAAEVQCLMESQAPSVARLGI